MGSVWDCSHFLVANTTWVIIEELSSQNWTCTFIHQAIPGLSSLTHLWVISCSQARTHKSHATLTNLSCPSAAQCLSWTHTSHATLTNLSCPSCSSMSLIFTNPQNRHAPCWKHGFIPSPQENQANTSFIFSRQSLWTLISTLFPHVSCPEHSQMFTNLG